MLMSPDSSSADQQHQSSVYTTGVSNNNNCKIQVPECTQSQEDVLRHQKQCLNGLKMPMEQQQQRQHVTTPQMTKIFVTTTSPTSIKSQCYAMVDTTTTTTSNNTKIVINQPIYHHQQHQKMPMKDDMELNIGIKSTKNTSLPLNCPTNYKTFLTEFNFKKLLYLKKFLN